jgi:peptidoglycan/LPS O-acetylase OafA/YrhL
VEAVSPLPAAIALGVAFITAMLIATKLGSPSDQGRFASIDGLRGYLAFFVFLHHSCIWYFYLRTGTWEVPPSNLYTNFGQSSVALFFMITSFLFFSKLIEGKAKGIDWGRLFISRILRLAPLYLCFMLLFFLLVAFISDGILVESVPKLTKGIVTWLGFRMLGAPDLNGVKDISTTVAGITWSLRYEWFFYLSLPVLALAIGLIPPRPYLALGILGVTGLIMWNPDVRLCTPFLGGIAASFLVRIKSLRNFAATGFASIVVLACAGVAMVCYPSGYDGHSLVLLSIAFTLIASGNALFGALTNCASRTLGEFAYSIYLLHCLLLYVVFNFIIGRPAAMALSPTAHWLVIVAVVPILIVMCLLTFRLIERPAMQSTAKATERLRRHILCRIR